MRVLGFRACRLRADAWSWRLAGLGVCWEWWEVGDLAEVAGLADLVGCSEGLAVLAGQVLAGRSPAGLGLAAPAPLGRSRPDLVGHSHSGPVEHIDLRLAIAGRSPGLPVGRKPGLDSAGYSRPVPPADRTAVDDRIETFFWKVEIEGSSDELKNSLKWTFCEKLFVELVVREGLENP